MRDRFKEFFQNLNSVVDEIEDISDLKELILALKKIEEYIENLQAKYIKKKVKDLEGELSE